MKRRIIAIGSVVILAMQSAFFATSQQELGGAKVTLDDGIATVSAEIGRPLYFSLIALSETYGWVVDYEDPIYSSAETRDATDRSWLQAHPNGRHFYVPADGKFSAQVGRVKEGKVDEPTALQKLLAQYNQSSNPGFFELSRSSQGRLAVTGRSKSQKSSSLVPVLNHDMSPSRSPESTAEAVQNLAHQCGSAAAVQIELGTVPSNGLSTSRVEGYEGMLSCRDQIGRILAALGHPFRYALLYDINTRAYYLNIVPAHRLVVGPDGKQTVAPL